MRILSLVSIYFLHTDVYLQRSTALLAQLSPPVIGDNADTMRPLELSQGEATTLAYLLVVADGLATAVEESEDADIELGSAGMASVSSVTGRASLTSEMG